MLQSSAFESIFAPDDRNLVVSSPTGSGKTVVFELCLVHLLSGNADAATGGFTPRPGRLKAVYLAPLKVLPSPLPLFFTHSRAAKGFRIARRIAIEVVWCFP